MNGFILRHLPDNTVSQAIETVIFLFYKQPFTVWPDNKSKPHCPVRNHCAQSFWWETENSIYENVKSRQQWEKRGTAVLSSDIDILDWNFSSEGQNCRQAGRLHRARAGRPWAIINVIIQPNTHQVDSGDLSIRSVWHRQSELPSSDRWGCRKLAFQSWSNGNISFNWLNIDYIN